MACVYQSESVQCFDLCLGSSLDGLFTNQGYEFRGPVVVLAHLVDFCIGRASAAEDSAAGQSSLVTNFPVQVADDPALKDSIPTFFPVDGGKLSQLIQSIPTHTWPAKHGIYNSSMPG